MIKYTLLKAKMIMPWLYNHFELMKSLVQSQKDHPQYKLIFIVHLSTQNPKLSPTIDRMTCKYLFNY